MKLKIYSVLILSIFTLKLNSQTANTIVFKVYKKMMLANDYSVDAKIKSDIPMIKILPVNAKVYFKQKDKFKIESKSIAILPKQGFSDFSKTIKDTNSYFAMIAGEEMVNKTKTIIINLIPKMDTGDLVLAKFWVNKEQSLVYKSQLTTKSNGTMLIDYFYLNTEPQKFGLPDSIVFTVDVKKFKIPKAVAADLNKTKSSNNSNDKPLKKGKIYIRFKNYAINKGISDKVFVK